MSNLTPEFDKTPLPGNRLAMEVTRNALYRRFVPILISAATGTIVFYGIFYLITGIWQSLVEAGFLAIAIGFALIANRLVRRHRLDEAALWILCGVAIAFAGNELVWEGATGYIAVGGVLMIVLAGNLVLPRRYQIWGPLAVLYTGAIFALNWTQPISRYNIQQNLILQLFIPGLTLALVLVAVWQFVLYLRQETIRTRLLVAFIVVVLVPVGITGVVSTNVGANTTQQRLLNQLNSVATLKEAEISTWLNTLRGTLSTSLTPANQDLILNGLFSQEAISELDLQTRQEQLRQQFNLLMQDTQQFDEIFILDKAGKVALSTDVTQEGKSYATQPLFLQGINQEYITPPFYSPSLGQYRVVVVMPLINALGDDIGVLAGRARMETLNRIMLERSGLGETGETYLVGTNHVSVTALRSGETLITVRTQGAEQALGPHNAGAGEYANAFERTVFGVYRWLPELRVALLAEQDRQEALQSVQTGIYINAGVAVASLMLAIIAALFITRSIAQPISDLAATTQQIAGGNLKLQAKVIREDEIGALAQSFNQMTAQIRELIGSLEQRVAERTHDLERRSRQVQVASEVARDITTTTNLKELLNQAVALIRDRFQFYHAGIFLLDEKSEYAVLRAATGEAGHQMLANGHKLRVGAVGIVGEATGSGTPHIALEVDQDPSHYVNPLLPDTRSEIALPLRVSGRIIGALDVQSTQPQAFDQDDLTVLQTLADQLAIAIENARLIQKMDQTVLELGQAYGRYTQDAWRTYAQSKRQTPGYRQSQFGVQAVVDPHPEALRALQAGETLQTVYRTPSTSGNSSASEQLSSLAVPVKLRGQVIGVVNLRFNTPDIPQDTILLVEEAVSRLALVLENSRLLQEAERMAQREQQINLIANQVRSSNELETILHTTVRELGKALGASRTFIQIGVPGLAMSTGNEDDGLQHGHNGAQEA